MTYQDIIAADVPALLAQQTAIVLDMRDQASFARGHIEGAQMVSDELLRQLRKQKEFERPVLLYCYHGISSRDMATFLAAIGFTQVFNLEGGWQAWEHFAAGTQPEPSPQLKLWYASNGFSEASPFARGMRGMTPLMLACLSGNTAVIDELLEVDGVIDLTNDDGNTALWFACKGDHTDIMRKLLRRGAAIDHQNPEGVTCLIYAASAGKLEVVQTLLDAGASLIPETLDGFTALDSAASLSVLRLLRTYNAPSTTG